MSDMLPLSQWTESNGKNFARSYKLNYIEYDSGTYTLFVSDPPPPSARAGFVQTVPGRWKLMPNPSNAKALRVVKRGNRTYVYPG